MNIVFEQGDYWVRRAVFGTGRFKPQSNGYEVMQVGTTHSKRVASIGYDGQEGLERAKAFIASRV